MGVSVEITNVRLYGHGELVFDWPACTPDDSLISKH